MPPQTEPLQKVLRYTLGIISLVGIIVVVAASVWYYKMYMAPTNSNAFSSYYQNAMGQYRSGDYSSAIASFTKALGSAPDETASARTEEMIAFNMFLRNQGDDQGQAISMYKRLIDNVSYSASVRALALADLATLTIYQGNNFAKKYFMEAPFDHYVSSDKGSRYDVFKTTINMFLASDALYPNSLAEYGIAYNNAVLILNNATSTMSPESAAKLVRQYVQKADAKVNAIPYMPSNIARQYSQRATAIAVSGRILNDSTLEDREVAFEIALSKGGAGEATDPQLRAVIMHTRLNYAIFLSRNDFGRNREADIQRILQPYANATTDPASYALTRGTFFELANVPDSSFTKFHTLKLANISPVLKSFLLSVGWEL